MSFIGRDKCTWILEFTCVRGSKSRLTNCKLLKNNESKCVAPFWAEAFPGNSRQYTLPDTSPANHRAVRIIVNRWLPNIYKIATCSVRPNWCHRARTEMLIIWLSGVYIYVLCAVICQFSETHIPSDMKVAEDQQRPFVWKQAQDVPDGTFRVFIPVHHQRNSSLGFLSAQAFFKAVLTRKFITEPIERAPSGQSETHLIQEMHRDLSTLRRLPAGIAPTGQAFAQTPQPVH